MSGLPGLALLVIVTQAFRARMGTSVTVEMQPDGPVDVTKGPVISLFVESAMSHERDVSLILTDPKIIMRIELFAPVDVPQGSLVPLFKGSAALYFIWRECIAALSPDSSPWAGLWELFRMSVNAEMFVPPLFETEKGVKIAAHAYTLKIDAVSEPAFGLITTGWQAFLDQLTAAGGELAATVPVWQAAITGGAAPVWEALAGTLGISATTLAALGLGEKAAQAVTNIQAPSGDSPDEVDTYSATPADNPAA